MVERSGAKGPTGRKTDSFRLNHDLLLVLFINIAAAIPQNVLRKIGAHDPLLRLGDGVLAEVLDWPTQGQEWARFAPRRERNC